jgi:hypothetical protein
MSKANKKKGKEAPFVLKVKVDEDEQVIKELQMKKKYLEERFSKHGQLTI